MKMHFTSATVVQCVLLGFYVLLAFMFGLRKETWPFAAYYVGCLVKDLAVFVLALMKG